MKKSTMSVTIDSIMTANNLKLSDISGNTDNTSKGFKAFKTFVTRYYSAFTNGEFSKVELRSELFALKKSLEIVDGETAKTEIAEKITAKSIEIMDIIKKVDALIMSGDDAIPDYVYVAYAQMARAKTADNVNTFKVAVAVWLYTVYGIKTNVSMINTTDTMLNAFTDIARANNKGRDYLKNQTLFKATSKKAFTRSFVATIAEYMINSKMITVFNNEEYLANLKKVAEEKKARKAKQN